MRKLQPFLSRILVAAVLSLLMLSAEPMHSQQRRIPGYRPPASAPQKKPATKKTSVQGGNHKKQKGKQNAKANNSKKKTSSKKSQKKVLTTQESPTPKPKWVQKESGREKGYAYVDLGLSVKWATCNVGATSPEDDGDRFAWGETKPKDSYTKDNGFACSRVIGDIEGRGCYDAVSANWGGVWRMPTHDEIKELKERCSWTWTTVNGVNGYVVKSNVNENSIFLPFHEVSGASSAVYWSSSNALSRDDACSLKFFNFFNFGKSIYTNSDPKYRGCFVRPVFGEVLQEFKSQTWVQNETGKENGYAYVDLGLSVKWATCNVGATSPEAYGDYFSWGETVHKDEYNRKNCANKARMFSDIAGKSHYDVAQAKRKGSWRLPTKAEQDELRDKCDWRKAKVNGMTGYVVTSKINGDSIFLPAAGYLYDRSLNHCDENCYYWSSTPKEDHTDYAYNFFLSDSVGYIDYNERERGMTIRPVAGDPSDIQAIKGIENGHEWVDLGLSAMWATCNVGATKPEEYGEYFTQDKALSNSVWGGTWRLPTSQELTELKENCTWKWSVVNGVNGYKVSSKVNGNSIFLPAAGYMDGSTLYLDGVDGYCWSSEVSYPYREGKSLRFYNGYTGCVERNRSYCMSVRPVIGENNPPELQNKWIQKETGGENGYAYVDLGLSVKWATCNVGATSPEGYGDYFAWGETKPKVSYTSDNSATYGKEFGDIGGNPAYDAARANWGGEWRLPTKAEQEELINKCDWTYDYKANGYIVKSKINGNSIFIPEAGYMDGSWECDRDKGYYWSSTCDGSVSSAHSIKCNYESYSSSTGDRSLGQSVRPVTTTPTKYGFKISPLPPAPAAPMDTALVESLSPNPIPDSVPASPVDTALVDSLSLRSVPESPVGTILEEYNGHAYVDLGLSVKWATCNVGATSPEDAGDYFAWGETSAKSRYNEENSATQGREFDDISGKRYDAARANWGKKWRLPTKAEQDELREKCIWTWTKFNGVNGYVVKSKVNGNSIFLPAAGYRTETSLDNVGNYGFYWSSTPDESSTQNAYYLYFDSSKLHRYWYYRYRGRSVRPVTE